jgi:glycosyltransferase involved in cell wall biosynthesis
MRNLLLIKLRYIGDVLLATPTVRAIKAAQPDVRVTMMVNRGTEDVLSGNPDLDEIVVLDKGSLAAQWQLIAGLRSRRFDTVIDLTDGDRSAFLSWISGAPVLTSNSTALAEVAGDAAVLADPQDARALGEAMISALEDEPLRAALKVKGFDRAKQFSWEQAATKTVALYGELCRDDR